MNSHNGFIRARMLAVLALIAIVAGGATYVVGNLEKTAERQLQWRTMSNLLSNLSTINKLDDVYSDEDNNLLADTPQNQALLARPDQLTFSFIASDDSASQADVWQPVVDALSEKTGIEVTYLKLEDIRQQLAALRNGQLHVTAFGSGTVPSAVNSAGFIPVCTFGKEDGQYGYAMQFIVDDKSAINSVADLRPVGEEKKSLAFTRPRSNSGCKAAVVLLIDNGLFPERDYDWSYSYGHDASVKAVLGGKVDAAPVASDLLARLVEKGDVAKDAYGVIYESEGFPPAAFGFAYNLAPELQQQIRETLLNFEWAGTPLEQEFGAEGTTQFVAIDYKDDWANIRRIDQAVTAERSRLAATR